MVGRYEQHGGGSLLWLAMAAATLVWPMATVQAAVVVQYEVVHGSTYFVLDLNITNNDTGAIYNSGTLNVLKAWTNSCGHCRSTKPSTPPGSR